MLRRSLLKKASGVVAAAGIGLSGCVGAPEGDGSGNEEPTPEGTEPPGGTETPTGTEPGGATETGTPTGTAGEGTEEVATHFRLGGRVEAWQGRAPSSIADADNPTLQMEAGQRYRVTWENLDGVPHDFVVEDDQGNALVETEQASEEGRSLSVTFTAPEDMAQYVCTIHPETMVGEVQIGG